MRVLLRHWVHLAPVLVGVGAGIYAWLAGERGEVQSSAAQSRRLPVVSAVRPVVARRGVILLIPLFLVVGTGAALYGLALVDVPTGWALVAAHVVASLLVCMLVVYKIASLDPTVILCRAITVVHVVAVAQALLLGPLLLTGLALLAAPNVGSFAAYLHLIAAAWWTLFVFWHLVRYLAVSVQAVRQGRRPAGPPGPGKR